jgi:hypothetical protein
MHRMDPNYLTRPSCHYLQLSAVFPPKAAKFEKENLVKTLMMHSYITDKRQSRRVVHTLTECLKKIRSTRLPHFRLPNVSLILYIDLPIYHSTTGTIT